MSARVVCALALCALILALESSHAQPIAELWDQPLPAPPVAAPIAADIHDTPGEETLVLDGAAGRIVCIAAGGGVLWEAPSDSAAPPAVLPRGQQGNALVLAYAGGEAVCIDGQTATERWRAAGAGKDTVSLLWVDLEEDGEVEAIVAGAEGVAALRPDGRERWRFESALEEPPIVLTGPVAAADANGDGITEIFGLTSSGPFSLDDLGVLKWRSELDTGFSGVVALSDSDADDFQELYAVARGSDGLVLHCFDADIGDLHWKTPLSGADEPSGMALGDFEGDGATEVAVTAGSSLFVVSAKGKLLWSWTGPNPVAAVLGDVDGDGGIEVVAAGAGMVHVLAEDGALKTERTVKGVQSRPPALGASGNPGQISITVATTSGVQCLGLGAPYVRGLLPWPMWRQGPAQTSAIRGSGAEESAFIREELPVLTTGGFEEAGDLEGWQGGALGLETAGMFKGAGALRIEPAVDPRVVLGPVIPVTPDLRHVTAVVFGSGAAAAASLEWHGRSGLVARVPLPAFPSGGAGWNRHALTESPRPLGAQSLRLALEIAPDTEKAAIVDEIQLSAAYQRVPRLRVFVNQLGYDAQFPKRFTVETNFQPADARFELLAAGGGGVHEDVLSRPERINGGTVSDWGGWYARGDFSGVERPGSYQIRVRVDGRIALSPPFEIDYDLLWKKALPLALKAIEAHRCGAEVSGIHGACHLDDAVPGAWHDGSTYGKARAPVTLELLADSYAVTLWRFAEEGGGTPPAIAGEIAWGAAALAASIGPDGAAIAPPVPRADFWGAPEQETDNLPNTGDERPAAETGADTLRHAAALARAARTAAEPAAVADAAGRALRWCLAHAAETRLDEIDRRAMAFTAAVNLWKAGNDTSWLEIAKAHHPGIRFDVVDALVEYSSEVDIGFTLLLGETLKSEALKMAEQADNPFGVFTGSSDGRGAFFTAWLDNQGGLEGSTRRILEAAGAAARVGRFAPDLTLRAFLTDQINWIFGCNPLGVCLVEGPGEAPVPSYFHGYSATLQRGAVTGAIANGFTAESRNVDRPKFDMSGAAKPDEVTNGVRTDTVAAFINTVAHTKRNRTGGVPLR